MTTILVNGEVIHANQFICDPLQGKSRGPIVLRVQLEPEEAKRFDGPIPIVFPLATTSIEANFGKSLMPNTRTARLNTPSLATAP
jgi:hypothetical protein